MLVKGDSSIKIYSQIEMYVLTVYSYELSPVLSAPITVCSDYRGSYQTCLHRVGGLFVAAPPTDRLLFRRSETPVL